MKATKGLPRVEGEDDGIGLGRGFRGHSRFAGPSLAALLKSSLPAGTDPGLLFVVVTASDGYRSLYSGGEILLSRLPENVVLVDTEDGKPLLRKSGRLKSVARGDFFVDRSVRSLAEIRCVNRALSGTPDDANVPLNNTRFHAWHRGPWHVGVTGRGRS